jgi:hypothetical protein
MTCNDVREKCQCYLDGELDSSESCCFAAHVDRCAPCRAFLQEQRSCHSALERASSDCVRAAVPSCLASRAFARLDAACAAQKCPISPTYRRWMVGFAGVAALLVLSATGYYVWCGMYGECRWVVAASNAHDSIVQGKASVLASSSNLAELRQVLSQHGTVPVAPCLERCKLKPHHCGEIQVADCTGIYVCYQEEGTDRADTTLLILPTSESPRGEQIREQLTASTFTNHSILSWRTPDNRYLCLFITRKPIEQTLPLAEVAKSETAALATR